MTFHESTLGNYPPGSLLSARIPEFALLRRHLRSLPRRARALGREYGGALLLLVLYLGCVGLLLAAALLPLVPRAAG